ncbi:MAG: hypothetical protein KDA84_21345, partial [Planctomycetaceae bacterium]|nr:hypothetical protein [Planctomycetaceae bacterium]
MLGGLVAWCAVAGLHWLELPLAERLLPLKPLAILIGCTILHHISDSLSQYARAHKREPFVGLFVCSNLAITFAIWWGGHGEAGATGAVCGFFAVLIGFTVPVWIFIWWKARHSWRT